MLISLFPNRRATEPETHDLPWPEIREMLFSDHEAREEKDGPAFVPASFDPPRRLKKNVVEVSIAVLDVDKGKLPIEDASAMLADLEHLIYTTHSHTPERPAYRVILPLARPVPASSWPLAFRRATRLLEDKCDPACKDASRLFYLPACRPGREGEARVIYNPGSLLDLEVTPSGTVAASMAPAPALEDTEGPSILPEPKDLTPDEIEKRLPADPLFRTLIDGRPFPDGERDQSVHVAVSRIVWLIPEVSERSVVEFFVPTVNAMAIAKPEDPIPLDKVAFSYRRAREALEDARRAQKAAEASLRAKLSRSAALDPVAQVFRQAARAAIPVDLEAPAAPEWEPDPEPEEEEEPTGTFSEAELADLAAIAGCDVADLDRRWIIQRGTAFYVLTADGYRPPITRDELLASLPRDLARAPVDLWVVNEKTGEARPRSLTSIILNHCTVARQGEASLIAQRSSYDPRTETFTEAVAPVRRLRARYHEPIARWLELLGGKHAEKLLDWVATVTDLSRPTAAIYFVGPGGAGKTMFGQGIARLWTTGSATSAAQVLGGDFNAAIATCPLIMADEALPKRVGQRATSAELRELIASVARPYKRKYLADSTLHGAIRLVLAANNDRLLDLREDLDSMDQAAVAERFLVVHVPEAASRYLESIGGRTGTAGWVDGDKIAEHALYLARTRKVKPAGRWIVKGEIEEVHERLSVSSGVAGAVVEWICRYMADPARVNAAASGIVVGNGEILINPTFMVDNWEIYVRSDRTPSLHAVGRALRNLSAGERCQRRIAGKVVWLWPVRVPTILRWAEDNLAGDPAAMLEKVNAEIKGAA